MLDINQNRRAKSRIRFAEIICFLIPFVFTAFFSYRYLYLPYKDPSIKEKKEMLMYSEVSTYAKEGEFLDRDGNIILQSDNDSHIGYANETEKYAYAYLLGYYKTDLKNAYRFGLRGSLVAYSWGTLDTNKQGATTHLTTNNALQNYAFDLLDNTEGSITVINNQTGEILALASYGNIDYDLNDPSTFLSSDIPQAQYRRGTFEKDPPGSTFKVITATAALTYAKKNHLSDDFFQYEDTGSYTAPNDGWVVKNYGDAAYGLIDLDGAMENSVNCYFANLGVTIGAKEVTTTAEKFMLNKDIEIPFLTSLHSKIDIANNDYGALAQTSFGQGNTEITPVHLALVASAVQNNGIMMSPYIVKSITSGTKTLYQHSNTVLSEVVEEDIAARVSQSMHQAALSYGFAEDEFGYVSAKTGTAECGDDRIHSYMIGSINQYSFCISFNNMSSSGYIYPIAHKLVNFLNNM